ncbi:MAG: hypothetical protein AAF570_29410, partial [Bacteroidota bacterium]
RADRRDDYRELWQLARTMMNEGTMTLDGRLSAPFLRAAVRSACFAGEARWARAFLNRYGEDLVGPEKAHILTFHRLMVAYYEGDYPRVMRGSALLRHGNPRFEVLLRILQLKATYDLGEGEDFLRMAAAFRKVMRRKTRLGKRFIEGYAAFGALAEKLGKCRFGRVGKEAVLVEEIRASQAGEKLWLLEKAEELS